MKYFSGVFLLLALHINTQAQKDTVVNYYDISDRVCKKKAAVVVKKSWTQDGVWKDEERLYPSNILQLKGSFSDQALKEPNGKMTRYFANGNKAAEETYLDGKQYGQTTIWTENGNLYAEYQYKNGRREDSSFIYYRNGKQLVNDKKNGIKLAYYQTGQQLAEISLKDGKKNGKSVFYTEAGVLLGTTVYVNDSVIRNECHHLLQAGDTCIPLRSGDIAGGAESWRNHLEKNLQYPDFAQENNIQGVVEIEFNIDTLGNASGFTIVSSPHYCLSEEALRVMKLVPKWQPNLVHNQPVSTIAVKKLTFRLEYFGNG